MTATASLDTVPIPTVEQAQRFVADLWEIVGYWKDGMLSEAELVDAELRLIRNEPVWQLSDTEPV